MKRLPPRRFNELTAISALLCLATIAAWFSGFPIVDLKNSTPSLIVVCGHHCLSVICEKRPHLRSDKFPDNRHILAIGNFLLGWARSVNTGNWLFVAQLPLQYIFALGLPMPVLWLIARRKQSINDRWKAEGRCLECGYDLQSTPDRCPECGTIPPKNKINSN
jgi:hypothetical protein